MQNKNLLFTTIAIFGFALTTIAQTTPPYVPTNGLVGWWPFNGNANDESGNGNNGTVNGATLTSDRFGNTNKAYGFDGTSNYIEIADSPSLQFNSNLQTISFWINIPQIPQPTYLEAIIDKFNQNLSIDATGNSGTGFLVHFASNGSIYYSIKNGAGYNWGDCSIPSSEFSANQNYHILFTNDNDSLRGFVNGIRVSASKIPTGTAIGTTNFSMLYGKERGTNNGIGMDYFNGVLDDIAIWNRALTQQEVIALYQSCILSVATSPSNLNVNIGNTAQFIVASSGSSATYQWQTDLGTGFQNISNSGQYNGAIIDTLTVANTTMSNDNQQFRCILNSGPCSDTSTAAILTVINDVGITEPGNQNQFLVYPNPATNQINVKADMSLVSSVYTIRDHIGKVVVTGKLTGENTLIELGNLSGGIYLFIVGENAKQAFKVVKE